MCTILYSPVKTNQVFEFKADAQVDRIEFMRTGGFVFSPHGKGRKTYFFKGKSSVCTKSQKQLATCNLFFTEGSVSDYKNSIERAINDIGNGLLKKVVLARTMELHGELNYLSVFYDLVNEYEGCFVTLVAIDGHVYLGATPELLVRRVGGNITSVALAGTLPLRSSEIWRDKELEEHRLVTEAVADVFERYCSVTLVGNRTELNAGTVKHLYQEVKGELNGGVDFFELVNDLHPTPAVAGVPREAALDWIEKHENIERDYYTGYLGLHEKDSSELFVNLRCLECHNKLTKVFVGGGIVEGSTFDSEYLETQHKAETLLSSIRKFHEIKFEH